MLIHKREIHIEWGDCDPAGIVYFPRYFAFFDACTAALFEHALGISKAEMLRKYGLIGIPLVDAQSRFLVPSSYGDTVRVESRVVHWGKTSFRVEHKLFRDVILAVEGSEARVWTVRTQTGLSGTPIPREVIGKFEPAAPPAK